MKTSCLRPGLSLLVGAALVVAHGQTYVTPKLGGGQVAAEMVHIDVYYDAEANYLSARVDDSFGLPQLRPLEPGLAFDPEAPFAVLNGKAYNAQYGWNVGGFFTIPAGAAIWIEETGSSPGLETYEGWGRTGSHLPLFGTFGSPLIWPWSGVMVHNTYAVLAPATSPLFAEYAIYFGDATTGAREGFLELDDARVRLEWTVELAAEPLQFGALAAALSSPLAFLNADRFVTEGEWVMALLPDDLASPGSGFERIVPMLALPATAAHGGPSENHALPGACLELQFVSLSGPPDGHLSVWENDAATPLFTMNTAERAGTHRCLISQNEALPGTDPYGHWPARRLRVDQPGLYTLGFQVVDTSKNGTAGTPLHAPSDVYHIFLQAGVTLAGADWESGTFTASFGGTPGWQFSLERRPALAPATEWQTIAGPLSGTNRLQRLIDPQAGGWQSSWYRLRAEPD